MPPHYTGICYALFIAFSFLWSSRKEIWFIPEMRIPNSETSTTTFIPSVACVVCLKTYALPTNAIMIIGCHYLPAFDCSKMDLQAKSSGLAPLLVIFFPHKPLVRSLVPCLCTHSTWLPSSINQFQDPATRRLIRVNYAALDVEEFGSVYEGLLEYEAAFQETHSKITFEFVKGDDRSSSGSHYT